jgi:hypothetical protein
MQRSVCRGRCGEGKWGQEGREGDSGVRDLGNRHTKGDYTASSMEGILKRKGLHVVVVKLKTRSVSSKPRRDYIVALLNNARHLQKGINDE